jgi:hypothetical protein
LRSWLVMRERSLELRTSTLQRGRPGPPAECAN